MPSSENQAAHPVSVFKKINRLPVRPVIFSGSLTNHTCSNEDDGEKPNIPPLDLFWFCLYLWNPFTTEICCDPPEDNEQGKYPWCSKKQVSRRHRENHDHPCDG